MKNVLILAMSALLISVAIVACGKKSEPLPTKNVCFETNILPLIKRDCAFCHWHGEYYIKLRGEAQDYDELMRYIDPAKVEEKGYLLSWASGYKKHPILWVKGSPEYNAVKAWILEGHKKTCGDSEQNSTEQKAETLAENNPTDAGASEPLPEKEIIKEKTPPEPQEKEVSFAKDIAPLLGQSCARCHAGGRFGIRLQGKASDYSEVMRFVNKKNPGAPKSFLWWCADAPRHQFWSHSSSSYQLTLKWIKQGAKNN